MKKVRLAIIGVGSISGIYLKNITETFHGIEIAGVCDLVREKAEAASEKYGLHIYKDMHEAFADPTVELVLNITRPHEHYEVTRAALLAGKNVYSEKPLAASLPEGLELVRLAQEKGLLLGGAPDTFMGAGIQTCRRLIDGGMIGTPIGFTANMICHGHETWHPDPAFYYQYGGGPMMDMGPYYLTALVNLLGRAKSVFGKTRANFPTRLITSKPKMGEVVKVEVPTDVMGILEFDSGAVGTVYTTFDVYYNQSSRLEIYGTEGTLFVPDPNCFGGPVMLLRPEDGTAKEIPLLTDYKENSRALGLADMAQAMVSGREFRTDYTQTLHVLEIMSAFALSSQSGTPYVLQTPYERKMPMKNNPMHGVLDA